MKTWIRVLLTCATLGVARGAPEFATTRTWLHLNGYSHHFNAPDAQPFLWGIGVTHYTQMSGPVARSWEADMFRDSAGKPSGYVGHTWTVPTGFLSLGVTGAVMYHRNFKAQNRAGVLPVLLPFAETRGSKLKFRIYYVPPVRKASDQQLAVQVLLPSFSGSYARRLP